MFPAEFQYFAPTTVSEAVELLSRYGDDAKVLAGGQSLIPMMKLRIASPRYLVDVNGIGELGGLRCEGDRLLMGALCRHADVIAAPVVREHLPLMHDAAQLTADVQVRNRGTVAGSLAHADPAGDWPAALLTLDTDVTIAGPAGTRTLTLAAFIVDAYTTQLGPGEIVTQVTVTIPSGRSGGAYAKFERRAGDFAVASAGVQVTLDEQDRCAKVAVTLGAVGPIPFRAHGAEDALQGHAPSESLIESVAHQVREAANPFADTRGSVEYKRHLAGVLFRRAFATALARARGETVATVHL
jgi:aerobic carbon-monoxide dehydrogenase medium subunit